MGKKVPLPFTWKLAAKPWKQPPRILTREKIMELSKDYRGRSANCNRLARNRVEKGLQHAFRVRKNKSRNARTGWIQQINAGARTNGIQYSQLIHGMRLSNVALNRKILANFAHSEPLTFAGICQYASIQDGIKPKVYANCGYVQSAVITQKVQKPVKHLGKAHENAFLKPERENFPPVLTHETFQLPMYLDYVQVELPSRVDYRAYRHQCEKKRREQVTATWEETKQQVNPSSPVGQYDITRGIVRDHWKKVYKNDRKITE
jgi:large subunit ribosomal protein L20